jgi:hypothetical protein
MYEKKYINFFYHLYFVKCAVNNYEFICLYISVVCPFVIALCFSV